MKAAKRAQIERALDAADPAIRLYLLYGPDESGSRALADRLARAMGDEAERIDLAATTLRGDPARLSDEAAAGSLFGGARHIRVDPAGDECAVAAEALLSAPAAGNPVILIAGALRRDSAVLKLALDSDSAWVFQSFAPEGAEADRLAAAIALEHGLEADRDIAHQIAQASGGDRAVLTREVEKLALYLDAAPERPRPLDQAALHAVAAGREEADLGRLVDAVLDGDGPTAEAELRQHGDAQAVQIARALLQRLNLLVELATGAGEGGASAIGGFGKSLFWKDKPAVERQLRGWRMDGLTRAIERLGDAERAIKSTGSLGLVALEAELLLIARQAARQR